MATIESFSTQKNENDKPVAYRLRNEEDVRSITHYALNGNTEKRPVFSSSRGFTSSMKDADMISEEILLVQDLHRKKTGIRIRAETVRIGKEELGNDKLCEVKEIADGLGGYYLGLGHQVAYGIYDHGSLYEIRYAINPVSFADGSKYRYNKHSIHDQEEMCLATIIADTTGRDIPEEEKFDFEKLENY